MTETIKNQELLQLLRLPSRVRGNLHTDLLVSLTSKVSFFIKITEEHNSSEVHRLCCEVMTVEEYEKNDIIVNFGDPGDKFYIILAGSASVLIPLKRKFRITIDQFKNYEKICRDEDYQSEKSSSSSASVNSSPRIEKDELPRVAVINVNEVLTKLKEPQGFKMIDSNPLLENEEKILLKLFKENLTNEKKEILNVIKEAEQEFLEIEIDQMQEVGVFKEGDGFGELALISNRPRAATVIAREDLKLLVLRKSQFKEILGTISEKKVAKKVKFLRALPFFTTYTKISLSKLAYFFQVSLTTHKQLLFEQGQKTSGVYFIKSGEFLLSQKICNYEPNCYTFQKDSSKRSDSRIRLQKLTKDIKVVIKGSNESIGSYELINNLETRKFTCTCISSEAEVYFLSSEHFWTRVPNLETIKSHFHEESKRIDDRLSQIPNQVPRVSSIEPSIDLKSKKHLISLRKSRINSPVSLSPPLKLMKFQQSAEKPIHFPKLDSYSEVTMKKPKLFTELTEGQILEAINGRSHSRIEKPRSTRSFVLKRSPPMSFLLNLRPLLRKKQFNY